MKIEKGLRFIDGCYNTHTVTSVDENGILHDYYDGDSKRFVSNAFMYRTAFERLVRVGALYVIKEKSIRKLTEQRNRIQEWLINSGAWKRHPKMYKWVECSWRRYVKNIECFEGKKLIEEHFDGLFANSNYQKEIYTK
jgi:hypothetical protein